jgi:hypothetical protein
MDVEWIRVGWVDVEWIRVRWVDVEWIRVGWVDGCGMDKGGMGWGCSPAVQAPMQPPSPFFIPA